MTWSTDEKREASSFPRGTSKATRASARARLAGREDEAQEVVPHLVVEGGVEIR
jgi:hypothetical protein